MNSKQVISSILTAAMFVTSFGCSAKKTENPKGSDIKEFTGFFWTRNEPLDADNEIRSLIAEKTGCILYEEWIDDQDNLDKLFSDMIIANKYPDFLSPDAENCQKLIKEGTLIPIDNYWDAYPNLKELCSEDEWDRVRAADGHIYYMPLFSSVYQKDTNTTHEGEAFWVQLKVLKWANYPQLKTLDDYFGLIEDYLEANPTDDNGEPYIGYEIQANDAWFFALDNPPMFLDGHPNDGCCYVDPDTLEAKDYNMLPTAKAWYKKLNEEYQKGVVDQHCFVMSSEEYYSTLASGRVLGMVDQHWNFNSSTRELPAECTYIPFGLTIDGKIEERYADRTAFNDSTGVGISISCSDPDGAVKFLSQLIEPEILNLRFWGVEGVDYTVDENGVFDQTEEQYERWREKSYLKKHVCNYSYMPYFVGMAHDGINAYTSSNQPNIFYDHLNDTIKECFDAYGVRTYTEKLNPAPENPKWYPMWSFSNAVTDETDYGKVMKQLDAVKHKYMPLMVMSDDFEKTWKEYTTEYNKADPQVYFDELTAEVHRRCDK